MQKEWVKNIDTKEVMENFYSNLLAGLFNSLDMTKQKDVLKDTFKNSKEVQEAIKETEESFKEFKTEINKIFSVEPEAQDTGDEKEDIYFYMGSTRYVLFTTDENLTTYIEDIAVESITKVKDNLTKIITKSGNVYNIKEPRQQVIDKLIGLYNEEEGE